MEEQLISFKTAKLAKEKEFDLFCRTAYTNPDSETSLMYDEDGYYWKVYLLAPTQSLLQKWLRDKFSIHIVVDSFRVCDSNRFDIDLTDLKTGKSIDSSSVEELTYEDAMEIALQEALTYIT